MSDNEFLKAVLPSGGGYYCAVELPAARQTFVQDISALDSTTQLLSIGGKESYFALAVFQASGSRTAFNALAVRAIFVDIDCGKDTAKTYSTKREAILALQEFGATTGLSELGDPWVNDSGGGVHVYYPLKEDACIEDWKPVAEAYKNTAARLGFKIDMTVTADAARILRPPGTLNHKYTPPRLVTSKLQGDFFTLEDIAARLDKVTVAAPGVGTAVVIPKKRPAGLPAPVSPVTAALAQNAVTLFKNIVKRTAAGTGCGQLQYYFDNAQADGMEPMWRGMLSLARVCDDGAKACTALTKAHPYTPERMNQKLAEIKGPYPCAKIDSENPGICGSCPHWGRITNPLALGREAAVDNTEKAFVVVDEVTGNSVRLHRPVPPKGFQFGDKGGVYREVVKVDANGNTSTDLSYVILHDFYMLDLLRQPDGSHVARFCAVRKNSIVNVCIPSGVVAGKGEGVIKCLAEQNIFAAFGNGNDMHLAAYVRACVSEASLADNVLVVPPQFGWQPDQSFVVGERVIQRNGNGYVFPDEAMTNIVAATRPKGTLAEWQKYMQLLQNKGLWDILGFAGVSFGSPLMAFAGGGTKAMTFHACGNGTGHGKSLAMQVAASVWGSPNDYPINPKTSDTTLLQRMGLLGSIPLCVDEVTSLQRASNGEYIPNLAFGISQGCHKIKGSATANAEIQNKLNWAGFCIITSNDPAMEKMLTMRDTTSLGELRRMLEWHATDKLVWTSAERQFKGLLDNNFGCAGEKYAEWLVNNVDVARKVTVEAIEWVRTKLNASDAERFYCAGIGCAMAGMLLAGPKYSDVFAFDQRSIFKTGYAPWVLRARLLIDSNAISAEDIVHAFLRENHGNFVRIDPAKGPVAMFDDSRGVSKASTRGKVAGRIEYNVRAGWIDTFLDMHTFKAYCGRRNHGYSDVFIELKKTMIIDDEIQKDLLSKTGGPVMRVRTVRISQQIDKA